MSNAKRPRNWKQEYFERMIDLVNLAILSLSLWVCIVVVAAGFSFRFECYRFRIRYRCWNGFTFSLPNRNFRNLNGKRFVFVLCDGFQHFFLSSSVVAVILCSSLFLSFFFLVPKALFSALTHWRQIGKFCSLPTTNRVLNNANNKRQNRNNR